MPKAAFLTIHHGDRPLGTLHLELYEDVVPQTVANFCALLERPAGRGYRDSTFHRIIPGFMAQGGDYTKGDGTGGATATGAPLRDENFVLRHDGPGVLSMANAGPNTNGSQFFVTFGKAPHLDGKHVVFGRVDLEQSRTVLRQLEQVATAPTTNRPRQIVVIVDCGVVVQPQEADATTAAAVAATECVVDEDEIDLDDAEEDEEEEKREEPEEEEEEEEEEAPPKTKAEALKQRMRKLKQKMNQARQLNRIAVQKEGERMGSREAMAKERKRQAILDKKASAAAAAAQNAKALATAEENGVDGKYIVQQADEVLKKAFVRSETQERNQFLVNDYHNPEGQHRNYQRNVRSLPRGAAAAVASTADTYDPLQAQGLSVASSTAQRDDERDGARRLAAEMNRRIDKSKKREAKRREREEDQDGDVSYINQRNKRFNQKINRTFDKSTAEIRRNLERGTAL